MAFSIIQEAGLPAYGEPPVAFSATGMGIHSEGFVVTIVPEGLSPWTGNFVRGLSSFDSALPHPNGADALVIAGGTAYVIDPASRRLRQSFGGAIVDAFMVPTNDSLLVLNHQGLSFEAIGPAGRLWRSRRISWDGFRSIAINGDVLSGESWCYDETWHQFTLNLSTGSVVGGAYPQELD